MLLAARNGFAYAYYSNPRRHFSFRGTSLRYYGGLRPLRVRDSRIPLMLRLANVFSKADSERAIEIPIANQFAASASKGELLEIGNVLAYYDMVTPHTIVDRYETIPGVLNEDALAFNPNRKFNFIVSVSTIEHIGFDEPELDIEKPIRVIRKLVELLSQRGRLLITVPFGYNPEIDRCFQSGGFQDFDVTPFAVDRRSLNWREIKWGDDSQGGRIVLVLTFPKQ